MKLKTIEPSEKYALKWQSPYGKIPWRSVCTASQMYILIPQVYSAEFHAALSLTMQAFSNDVLTSSPNISVCMDKMLSHVTEKWGAGNLPPLGFPHLRWHSEGSFFVSQFIQTAVKAEGPFYFELQ